MVLKRFFLFFILSTIIILGWTDGFAQKVERIVIDAGHGGHDPGAIGKNAREKDIALAIALKTGKLIEENLKGVEVIYTRKTDVFVELYRRARIANEAKADLFISIHCNANTSSLPYGSETYVMGLHRSNANLAVAQLENASILLEDDYHVQYDGFDPSSPEGYIFFSMLQNAFLDQSLSFASGVQQHFREGVKLSDRGVKQAGFLVLYKTTMPAVLIETGFISNLKEEKVLMSDEGQNKIASAIYRAVKDYKKSVERYKLTQEVNSTPNDAENANPASEAEKNLADGSKEATSAATAENGLVFKVQFLLSKNKLNPNSSEFKGVEDVGFYTHNGMYKYTAGEVKTEAQALKIRSSLVRKGFKDAFVIAFRDGERISLEQARKVLNN